MNTKEAYADFIKRLTHLLKKNPHLINTTLSNIFTMRLIGNKTHGDLAEIGIAEFVNQYMYDFKSLHVGKDLFRAKEHEEDIQIINEIDNVNFTISIKAYGDGPLQLSTDRHFKMFPRLKAAGKSRFRHPEIGALFTDPAFVDFGQINVLPLIYDEKKKRCNIMVFDFDKARGNTAEIRYEEEGRGRKHPTFRFYDKQGGYICEVRYGDARANALQRGLWTHTRNALSYFTSVTGDWIDYSENPLLVKLFSHALLSTTAGHEIALNALKNDIQTQKEHSELKG